MEKIRPQNDATPHAVPRTGAGNHSGVWPYLELVSDQANSGMRTTYRIALYIDWKKYTKPLMPI